MESTTYMKIIRSVCCFTKEINDGLVQRLQKLCEILQQKNFSIQTRRICSPQSDMSSFEQKISDNSIMLSVGTLSVQDFHEKFSNFCSNPRISTNIELSGETVSSEHANILFDLIEKAPAKTFNFTYVFNNRPSSPYFPSAAYAQDGFSIGLQPTDLAAGCSSLEGWFEKMKVVWEEIVELLKNEPDFLGIDSSIAPLYEGDSSLLHFIRRLGWEFSDTVTSDIYMKMTQFIKTSNPKPVGLCGLMLPCLEDFELAKEYETGNFSIERNVFLSLHSGLGIDTYPIGVDENPEKVVQILKLVQGLSNKYQKPLSVRFVSDGKAKIGEKTDFKNQYLKDVVIKEL